MRYVFAFEEGSKEQKYLLGGKGANLAEMTNLGLPVPPGFTITTEVCKHCIPPGDQIPDGSWTRSPRAHRARSEDGQAAR
jgi:pyruvate,orthophosphate dikinase